MNHKSFQTQKFALAYYYRLYKAKHAIDNKSPSKSKVNFSTRNITPMMKYQQDKTTDKLVSKLMQININGGDKEIRENFEDAHNKIGIIHVREQGKIKGKRSASKKAKLLLLKHHKDNNNNEKKSQSQKIQHSVSFTNPPVSKNRSMQIQYQNQNLIQRLMQTKSNYNKFFSKQREKRLKSYKKLLSKRDHQLKEQNQIRQNIFEAYEKIKSSNIAKKKRPQSYKTTKRRSSATTSARQSAGFTNNFLNNNDEYQNDQILKQRPQTANH